MNWISQVEGIEIIGEILLREVSHFSELDDPGIEPGVESLYESAEDAKAKVGAAVFDKLRKLSASFWYGFLLKYLFQIGRSVAQ